MKCPNCGREMKIMWVLDEQTTILANEEYTTSTVVGRCEEWDYDAQWERRECGLRRFFFG